MNGIAQDEEEPGTENNLLNVDPNDAKFGDVVRDWRDGNYYRMTVVAQQISPGVFRVFDIPSGEQTEATDANRPADAPDAAEVADEAKGQSAENSAGYPNPAIDRML